MSQTATWSLFVSAILVLNVSAAAQSARPNNDPQNLSPIVATLSPSLTTIVLPCPSADMKSQAGNCPPNPITTVQLTTTTANSNHDRLRHSYKVDAGVIKGEGASVIWDLQGVAPGSYTASVEKYDGFGGITTASTTVTVVNCPDCVPGCVLCPTIASACPDEVEPGMPLTFSATVGQGPFKQSYHWTVSSGTITSGQGTTAITVSTEGSEGQSVTATLEVEGVDPSCGKSTSCTTNVKPRIGDIFKFDEYGNIPFRDEKARLDNFAIQLQNEPNAVGYIIGYGTCSAEGRTRANRARDYVLQLAQVASERVVVVDGGCASDLLTTVWILPRGSTPQPETFRAVSPCPPCKKKPPGHAASRPRA